MPLTKMARKLVQVWPHVQVFLLVFHHFCLTVIFLIVKIKNDVIIFTSNQKKMRKMSSLTSERRRENGTRRNQSNNLVVLSSVSSLKPALFSLWFFVSSTKVGALEWEAHCLRATYWSRARENSTEDRFVSTSAFFHRAEGVKVAQN